MPTRPLLITSTLTASYPVNRGHVASVSRFLHDHLAGVVHLDQHVADGQVLLRAEWHASPDFDDIAGLLAPLAKSLQMNWRLDQPGRRKRLAILVSKEDHCLVDLLERNARGELDCDIPLVISNHADCRIVAEMQGADFYHVPVTAACKEEAELTQIELLHRYDIDLVVLARYMHILSPAFTARWPQQIINIHHGLLPAFEGERPYHKAFARGVKHVGATSHYVTAELDRGPIIAEVVREVTHRDDVARLKEKGRDSERMALARAVQLHLENRVLVYGDRTAIF